MGRTGLGEFEQLVLLACLRLGSDAYTVAVLEDLERAGRSASHAAVYIALKRLEERGLVSSRRAAASGPGGRARRVYSVEPDGRALLYEYRDTYLSMWEGLEGLEGTR